MFRNTVISSIQLLLRRYSSNSTYKINPEPVIKISSSFPRISIKPYDLIDCPDANLLRISRLSVDNQPLVLDESVKVVIDQQNVDIEANTLNNENEELLLEVPVQSDVIVNGQGNIAVSNLYSQDITVRTQGNISTHNIQSFSINLLSECNNINCTGLTLGNQVEIRTRGCGNITLEKMMGDLLHVFSDSGIITTKSCYAEASKFITLNGGLHLNNLHKQAEVYILEKGEFQMTGFHGKINATVNNADINLQLTEVYADSQITANNPSKFLVNISDFVEQHIQFKVIAPNIKILETLDHQRDHLEEGDTVFYLGEDLMENSLIINSTGNISIGKMSWMETVRQKMEQQKKLRLD